MVHISKWPLTGKQAPVKDEQSYVTPMEPIRVPFGETWIVDFNNPKTLKLIDELSQRSTINV